MHASFSRKVPLARGADPDASAVRHTLWRHRESVDW